eukprot:Amastigsp_a510585_31.p6 type:complete len:104 gc:universal Amastigsp_a510585_31:695-1006(+)
MLFVPSSLGVLTYSAQPRLWVTRPSAWRATPGVSRSSNSSRKSSALVSASLLRAGTRRCISRARAGTSMLFSFWLRLHALILSVAQTAVTLRSSPRCTKALCT